MIRTLALLPLLLACSGQGQGEPLPGKRQVESTPPSPSLPRANPADQAKSDTSYVPVPPPPDDPNVELQSLESLRTNALSWLARGQKPDGSWEAKKEDFNIGVTALATLAFLGAGYTQDSKAKLGEIPVGEVVRKAVAFLVKQQAPEGCLAPRRFEKYMYSHIVSTMALCEAVRLSKSVDLKKPAQSGVDFLVAAQNPRKVWRYSYRSGDNDTSVTGWAFLAFRSARKGGFRFPTTVEKSILRWMDQVTAKDSGETGYVYFHNPSHSLPGGRRDNFRWQPTPTDISVLARIVLNWKASSFSWTKKTGKDHVGPSFKLITSHPPSGHPEYQDFIHWFFGTLAVSATGKQKGPQWKRWNSRLQRALSATVGKDGAWEATDQYTFEVGKVCSTSINTLTVEVLSGSWNHFWSR